jgi:FKBP-type peptidyl-prolyl cis-trans isomerase SlyD
VRDATEDEIGQGTMGTGFFKLEPFTPGSDTLH